MKRDPSVVDSLPPLPFLAAQALLIEHIRDDCTLQVVFIVILIP